MSNGPAKFSRVVLNCGFIAGLIVAIVCLVVSARYLNDFQRGADAAISTLLKESKDAPPEVLHLAFGARMVTVHMALLSCGIFVGMAFGFLGFSLFLIGVQGDMDAEAHTESAGIKIARLSPGSLVIVLAGILIGVCATDWRNFEYQGPGPGTGARSSTADGESHLDNATDLLLKPEGDGK